MKALTLYAFSTENWQRPGREVNALWRLLVRDLRQRGPKCLREGIRLTAIGRRDRMPDKARAELARVERETAHCDRMTLFLALDYGGAWDIVQMAERIRQKVHTGEINGEPLDEHAVEALLGSAEVPPVDLLIRTGGDSRISNFLPWQLRYAELLFEPTFWPDFDAEHLDRAFAHFAKIHRRYGRIEEEQPAPARRGFEPV